MGLRKIDRRILDVIKRTIINYRMIEENEKIILALSGGKDSIFSMLALKELGCQVFPAFVDVGYDAKSISSILQNSQEYGFNVSVLSIREKNLQNSLNKIASTKLEEQLLVLDQYNPEIDINVTPCTPCYNCKVIALSSFAEREEFKTIIFGHHGTDVLPPYIVPLFKLEVCQFA